MRPLFFRVMLLAAVFGLLPVRGVAEEPGVSAKLHPWGLFNPGAWKTVRVVTETLNDQGDIVSVNTTDTKTTLIDIDNEGVTLEIQTCMEVAGKRFEAEPQTLKQGFHGELVGPGLKLKEPEDSEVVVEDRKIPCKSQQLEFPVANGKATTTIFYSATVAPYILRRESITTDVEGKEELSRTSVDVTAFDVPLNLLGNVKNGVRIQTVHKGAKGSVTTLATVLPEVPGGVVSSCSKEVNADGRLVRRSTLELTDFGEEPEKDRSDFGRKRPSRHRTKGSPR